MALVVAFELVAAASFHNNFYTIHMLVDWFDARIPNIAAVDNRHYNYSLDRSHNILQVRLLLRKHHLLIADYFYQIHDQKYFDSCGHENILHHNNDLVYGVLSYPSLDHHNL